MLGAVLHHLLNPHGHGPPIDYLGVGVAALAGWFGLPGPGEAALITAGVVAAHHHLLIGVVILAAFLGASAGGMAGWLVGITAGRRLLSAPGPLQRTRLRLLARGERLYRRHGTPAVFLAPSWAAGIHRMRWSRFLWVNAAAALAWALIYGLGSFVLGPRVLHVLSDVGPLGIAAIVALLIVGVLIVRRRFRTSDESRYRGAPPQ